MKAAGAPMKTRSETRVADMEKAAAVVFGVIEEANRRGMQVVMRPTTMPSPHGRDGPIEIATSTDGRTVMITLFDMSEDIRREFVTRFGESGLAEIIRESAT